MGKRVSLPSVDLRYIEFAQYPVYSPYSFVVQHQQRDPAVEDRDPDGVAGQDQLEVVVFHGITELPVAINAAEVKQVLSFYRCAHIRRNLAPRQALTGRSPGFIPLSSVPLRYSICLRSWIRSPNTLSEILLVILLPHPLKYTSVVKPGDELLKRQNGHIVKDIFP